MQITGSLFDQSYPDSLNRDYQRRRVEISFRKTFESRLSLSIHGDTRWLDYRETQRTDEKGWGIRLAGGHPLRWGWHGEGTFRIGEDRFGRRSLKPRREPEGDHYEYELGPDQKDGVRTVGLSLRRLRPFIFRTGYTLTARSSNSFGFSQIRHEFSMLASLALPWTMDLQILGTLQSARYTDSGIDTVYVLRAGEDVEARDDNNSLTLRLRRPLRDGPIIELRAAWYRNESLLVGRYYDKWQVGWALRWGLRKEDD